MLTLYLYKDGNKTPSTSKSSTVISEGFLSQGSIRGHQFLSLRPSVLLSASFHRSSTQKPLVKQGDQSTLRGSHSFLVMREWLVGNYWCLNGFQGIVWCVSSSGGCSRASVPTRMRGDGEVTSSSITMTKKVPQELVPFASLEYIAEYKSYRIIQFIYRNLLSGT